MSQIFRRLGITAALLAATFATGCRTQAHVFEPACIAFSGDLITITGDRFAWDRYTDARRVDQDGNVIDPFPDYPKAGIVQRSGQRLSLVDEAGETVADYELIERDGETYLLTPAQFDSLRNGGELPACALRLRRPAT